MNDKLIYLDNAATTKVKPEVLEAMLPYFTDYYAHPSAVYNFSSKVRNDISLARVGRYILPREVPSPIIGLSNLQPLLMRKKEGI